MPDLFERSRSGLESPSEGGFSITPNDSTDLSISTRGLYVGVTGDVKVDFVNGTSVTFVGLAAGVIHPIRARRVYSTGTTATSLVGVY